MRLQDKLLIDLTEDELMQRLKENEGLGTGKTGYGSALRMELYRRRAEAQTQALLAISHQMKENADASSRRMEIYTQVIGLFTMVSTLAVIISLFHK